MKNLRRTVDHAAFTMVELMGAVTIALGVILMLYTVFDKVQSVVDTERALGRLQVPDVVAYRQVAEHLQSQGALSNQQESVRPPPASVPKTKAQDPAVVQQKRKAAAGTRKTTSKANNATSNYLGMTDEEFMKLADV